jgi:hypothetical protein
VGGGDPKQLPDGPHGRITRVLGLHGEHLPHLQGALGGTGHHIGEGAAPIDPESPTPGGAYRGKGVSGSAQTRSGGSPSFFLAPAPVPPAATNAAVGRGPAT